MIDITKVKETITSTTPLLTIADRQARDDSWKGRMFKMMDLQLRLGSQPTTEEEMSALADCYPLTESAMLIYRVGPTFEKPLDDDETKIFTIDVDDLDMDEGDDPTTSSIQVDGDDDDYDDQEYNPDDDYDA